LNNIRRFRNELKFLYKPYQDFVISGWDCKHHKDTDLCQWRQYKMLDSVNPSQMVIRVSETLSGVRELTAADSEPNFWFDLVGE